MDDHLLVEALREREPGVPAKVYDAYADRLYAYCWFQLRERDAAQVALRDTFVVAEAHIDKLRDPDRFGPWLYAVARLECARRFPLRGRPPDLPVASHDQEDVDQRIMAWQVVLALRPVTREILELRVRHQLSVPDLAVIFDMPVKEAQASLDRAHVELEEALTAEILVNQGPYGCAERADLLRERRGEHSHDRGGRLLRHAQECTVCGAFRPRTVSAAKVYGLLPAADPPEELRLRVMSCFKDPELVGYRLFVSTRVNEFMPNGFPVQPKVAARPIRTSRVRGVLSRFLGSQTGRVIGALAAVTLLFGGALASMHGFFGRHEQAGGVAGPRPTALPGLSQAPVREAPGIDQTSGSIAAAPVSATFPLGARATSAPAIAPSSPPASEGGGTHPLVMGAVGTLLISPLFLDLAGGADGVIELRAEGGTVTWRAKKWGPLRLSVSSGRLEAGQTTTVRVHVVRRARSTSEGGITFQPGEVQVHVTWRPDAPGTSPSPTPAPTGSASPSTPPSSVPPVSPSSREVPRSEPTSSPQVTGGAGPATSPSASGESPTSQATGG